MGSHIAPLKTADLPPRIRSFWQLAGPGAVLVGLSIGAGELVMWPWITAKFGASMVWAAALGVFLQLWVNLEIGRWTIVTGEAPYTGFARVWMGFIYILLFLTFAGLFLPGWARVSGAALKGLIFGPDGPGADWMWTGLTFVLIAATLFGPKVMYQAMERIVIGMVVFITLGLIFVAFQVGTMETRLRDGAWAGELRPYRIDGGFPLQSLFWGRGVCRGRRGRQPVVRLLSARQKHRHGGADASTPKPATGWVERGGGNRLSVPGNGGQPTRLQRAGFAGYAWTSACSSGG